MIPEKLLEIMKTDGVVVLCERRTRLVRIWSTPGIATENLARRTTVHSGGIYAKN